MLTSRSRRAACLAGLAAGIVQASQTTHATSWEDAGQSSPQTNRQRVRSTYFGETDVLLASGSLSVTTFQRLTRVVPIVFANVIDPVGEGYVSSLARPGGNTTGFLTFEYSISGKWLELLKKLAPQTTRVAVLRDPGVAAGIGQFAAIQSAASSSGIELSVIDSREANEIERGLAAFEREPNGGVIVAGTAYVDRILRSSRLPHGTGCPRSTMIVNSLRPAA
jgi:ABC-type uncharacterized transport system substrate-binding protein